MAKILVADDDALIRRSLRTLLSDWGHEVDTVPDGAALLSHLASPLGAAYEISTKPDALILDLAMPRLNGMRTLDKLRRMAGFSVLPVIMLTASREAANVLDALRCGADDYVCKPLEAWKLAERLDSLLVRQPCRRTLPWV